MSEPYYSNFRSDAFPYEMTTYKLKVTFYVSKKYTELSQRQQFTIMNEVEHEHYKLLYNNCNQEYYMHYRNKNINVYPEGSWCRKFQEAKRILEPGY